MSVKEYDYSQPVTVTLRPDHGYGEPRFTVADPDDGRVRGGRLSHRQWAESFLGDSLAADDLFQSPQMADLAMTAWRVRVTGKMWSSTSYYGEHDEGFDVEAIKLIWGFRGRSLGRCRHPRRAAARTLAVRWPNPITTCRRVLYAQMIGRSKR